MSDELEDQIVDGATGLLDVAVDLFTDDEILRDIPFLGAAVGIARAGLSIRDRLFLKKVWLFLTALPKIKDEEKDEFWEQIHRDKNERDRVGETLLLALERFDSMKKPEMLAKVFAYRIKGKIKEDEFRRLASAIDLAFVDDLIFLVAPFKIYSKDELWPLVRAGLAQISPRIKESTHHTLFDQELVMQIELEITKLGNLFVRTMNDT